jgi:hypothetical protein
MLRNYTRLAILSLLLISCVSSSKKLQQGNYDDAISKSIKVLMKTPNNQEETDILKRAYSLANTADQDVIDRLKLSGQPDIWDEVLSRLTSLASRQERVERLPGQVISKIDFMHVDYNKEIAQSKLKAADYFYAHGVELLKNNDRLSARQAYNEFTRAKGYYPNYKDLDSKITETLNLGTNSVLFRFQNLSKVIVPQDFEADLLKITLQSLNRQWLNFYTQEDKNAFYDFTIYMNLKAIGLTPESLRDVIYDEEKTVDDGFQYVLDAKGNVQRDTLGNDIKIKKYKTIKCHVKETQMEKRASVSGTIDFYDNRNGQLVRSQNISTESVFDHRFAQATGDLVAMSEKTRNLININPIPFPSDLQLIANTAEDLKRIAKDYVSQNYQLLIN